VLADETWQVAALAFVFFALSAAFTPLFQSVIPDILPERETYSRALAYSRIAYTLEAVLSPTVAAVLLQFVASGNLFLCAAIAFVGSLAALAVARVPEQGRDEGKRPFRKRVFQGLRIYMHTPRLCGLLLLNFALSLMMAWVLVNSVGFAEVRLGDAERNFPILMIFFGCGAAAGAVFVPRIVTRTGERRVVLAGVLVFAAFGGLVAFPLPDPGLFGVWSGYGFASSLVLTPGGLVIVRSARKRDRPSAFAAHFSLSHAGWLVAYPLAGWLGMFVGLETAMIALCGLAIFTALATTRVWPRHDPVERMHVHPNLPDDHPHLHDEPATGSAHRHSHAYYIDPLHPRWSVGHA